ncbi:MAG: autotransporter outer membrane beta-barrel domain-containing protein, partial [Comamonadaceae bacterium]
VIVNDRLQGGSGSGTGVWIAAGTDNQLTVNATGSLSALSGVAVRYDGDYGTSRGSRLNIDNFGTLQGSVLCSNADGSTGCTLTNHTGAVASNAQTYNANVRNDGLLVIGRPGQFDTLAVTGNLTQSSSGVLRADVDFDQGRASRLVVQGDANLAGSVDVLPRALLPARELSVLTVQGTSQGSLAALDSPVFNYETRTVGQDTRLRVASADFNAPALGLKENQRNVASHLQRIWDGGGNSALAPLFAQLDLASRQGAQAYRNSVATLSPGVTIAPAAQSAANLAQFTGAMMSCPTFTGADALTREQNCAWGLVTGRSMKQDGGKGVSGFDFDTVTYQFGGQREVRPGWFVGGSAAYQNNHLRGSDRRTSGNGDSGYLGALLKRETGPWVFAAALGAGYGSYKMDREIDIAGYQDKLESRPDVYGVNARLRAARFFAIRDDMYVKPYVDLDASYTKMPGYKESGSNPLALSVRDADQFIVGLSPMIEFGGRKELSNKAMLRPFVYAGVTFLSRNDWKSSARLRGAPGGAAAFDTSLPMDNVVGKVGAGLQITQAGKADFRLQYDGQFGQKTRSNSATLKVMVPF